MGISSELTLFIIDQLAPIGHFTPRRMFGCTALFHDGLMVLLINDREEIFVKTDDQNRPQFIQSGCVPFTYRRRNSQGATTRVALSFWQLPDGASDEEEILISWVKSGIEAARRAAQ